MDSDSDSGPPVKAKRSKSEKGDTFEIVGKMWDGKKVKKQQRQQRLLEKLDRIKAENEADNSEDSSVSNIEKTQKKKRKSGVKDSTQRDLKSEEGITETEKDTGSKPGRSYTVSVAVAGSIIDNAQSPPLKAYLAGQVARAAAIFEVDEVIVYDDTGGNDGALGCEQMARILQFLECPQYLRKDLFPIHPDLQYAGLIAPLDIPHHLRKHEALPFRYFTTLQ